MTTTDILTALVRAWLDGQAGAGLALHDALEEADWPLEWRPPFGNLGAHTLHVGDWWLVCLHREGTGYYYALAFTAIYEPQPSQDDRWRGDLADAKQAAEAALRRALRGE